MIDIILYYKIILKNNWLNIYNTTKAINYK